MDNLRRAKGANGTQSDTMHRCCLREMKRLALFLFFVFLINVYFFFLKEKMIIAVVFYISTLFSENRSPVSALKWLGIVSPSNKDKQSKDEFYN